MSVTRDALLLANAMERQALTGGGHTALSETRSWVPISPGHASPGSSLGQMTSTPPLGSGGDQCWLVGIQLFQSDCEEQTEASCCLSY